MARKPAPCGTYAAYQRHRRQREDPCGPCSEANNAYQNEYRKRTGYRDNKAREIARFELARRHPKEFAALVREALDALPIEDPR